MITWAQRAASPSRFFETWDPVPRWKGQQVSRLRRMVRELTILLARTDSSKKSLITGRSSGAPIPISARNPDLFYEVRLSLHPRQYNPRCGQRLEVLPVGTGRCPRNIEWLRQPLGFESLALRGHSITTDSA